MSASATCSPGRVERNPAFAHDAGLDGIARARMMENEGLRRIDDQVVRNAWQPEIETWLGFQPKKGSSG